MVPGLSGGSEFCELWPPQPADQITHEQIARLPNAINHRGFRIATWPSERIKELLFMIVTLRKVPLEPLR